MVTITGPTGPFRLPTWTEAKSQMRQDRAVLITAILCVTLLLALFVAAIVWLSATGHSSETLTVVIVVPLVTALVSVASRLKAVEKAVDQNPAIPTPPKE